MAKRNNRKKYPNHSRYVKKMVSKPVDLYAAYDPQPFWIRYRFPFLLIVLGFGGIYFAWTFNPKPKELLEITALKASIKENQEEGLKRLFPDGYQLIKIEENRIVASDPPSGPSAFHVNWAYAKVYHFKENQIILHLPNLRFEPDGISTTADLSFLRSFKRPTSMLKSQGYDLVIWILDDHGDYLLCALGFRKHY